MLAPTAPFLTLERSTKILFDFLRPVVSAKELVSILTRDIFPKAWHPRAEPFGSAELTVEARARSRLRLSSPRPELGTKAAECLGPCLVGHHPIRSEGAYSPGPGLNVTCTLLCPRSPGLIPRLPYATC